MGDEVQSNASTVDSSSSTPDGGPKLGYNLCRAGAGEAQPPTFFSESHCQPARLPTQYTLLVPGNGSDPVIADC